LLDMQAVPSSQSGAIMAVDMSMFSGVRMLSPAVGAYMAATMGYSSIGVGASLMVGLLALLLHFRILPSEAPPQGWAKKPQDKVT
jgi:hypothetical protein